MTIAVAFVFFRIISFLRDSRTSHQKQPESRDYPSAAEAHRAESKSQIPESIQTRNNPSKSQPGPRRVVGKRLSRPTRDVGSFDPLTDTIQPFVFFSSLGATTEAISNTFAKELDIWMETLGPNTRLLKPKILDLSYTEYDDYFLSIPKQDPTIKCFYIILLS